MPLFQTPGCGIAGGSGSFTTAGFTRWGRPAPPGKAEPGGLDEPCRTAPSISLSGAHESLSLASRGAHDGCCTWWVLGSGDRSASGTALQAQFVSGEGTWLPIHS